LINATNGFARNVTAQSTRQKTNNKFHISFLTPHNVQLPPRRDCPRLEAALSITDIG